MAANTVVTIARQYGSGGREIGLRVAEKLKVKCYDKELLDRAAKDSGICQELFEHHDEEQFFVFSCNGYLFLRLFFSSFYRYAYQS